MEKGPRFTVSKESSADKDINFTRGYTVEFSQHVSREAGI